jgi:serine/threonine protein kinase
MDSAMVRLIVQVAEGNAGMKSIGKYEILDEIGSGATGTTYRARDSFRDRELVVRVLRSLPKLDAAVKREYCRELLACSELQHRHLTKVVDLGEVEGQIYIATDLLKGADLRSQAGKHHELPVAQKLGILAQACEGLGFAHSRGIAHGAIKPSNIFVDSNNDVTILDFGTAKWLSLILAAGSRPEELRPDYFAPEQILGQTFDSRSDLFSLGLVAYEFLAGQYPFQVPASLIPRELVHSEPAPLRGSNPELPVELDQLLARAFEKNPDQRLQTAEEFAAALYGIAQQLRRAPAASVPAATAPAKVPIPVEETAFSAPIEEPTATTSKRQEMETARLAGQPWTARSYAVSTSNTTASQTPAPQPVVATPKAQVPASTQASQVRPEAPVIKTSAPLPAVSVPIPAPLPTVAGPPPVSKRTVRRTPSPRSLKRRIIAIAAGAILAIYAVLNFVSHQGLHASQTTNQSPAQSVATTTPEAKRNAEPPAAPVETATPAVPSLETLAAAEGLKRTAETEQVLRRKVKTLWESGRYADAMEVVDQFLVTNPANAEARVWKKRIRAAQEAEAALK